MRDFLFGFALPLAAVGLLIPFLGWRGWIERSPSKKNEWKRK